jgi:ABC-type Fe3+-hydroxamate transport system substrate-binding protein
MKNTLSIIMILIMSLFLAGCNKDIEFVDTSDNNSTDVGNKVLKADAGEDITITEGNSTVVVGTVTVGDGEIVGYEWKEGTFLHSGRKQFTYTAPTKKGIHTLTFTVYDSNDKKSSDTMTITVTE